MKINNLKRVVLLRNSHFIPHTSLQPFFTTKPTGQRKGLGISYDIVKAHGWEIKVKSPETEGTEFIIYLPVNQK